MFQKSIIEVYTQLEAMVWFILKKFIHWYRIEEYLQQDG